MLPGLELMGCNDLAVPAEVMQHVVQVESSYNPYAIGVVGGHLVRQPESLPEAVATARMLKSRGYNFSLGLAQVNRAGSRILAECHSRSGGDWGKAFSCYYSGNFETGFRHGYVQKIYASMQASGPAQGASAIEVVGKPSRHTAAVSRVDASTRTDAGSRSLLERRAGARPVAHPQAPEAPLQDAASTAPVANEADRAIAQAQVVGTGRPQPVIDVPTSNSGAAGAAVDTAFVF